MSTGSTCTSYRPYQSTVSSSPTQPTRMDGLSLSRSKRRPCPRCSRKSMSRPGQTCRSTSSNQRASRPLLDRRCASLATSVTSPSTRVKTRGSPLYVAILLRTHQLNADDGLTILISRRQKRALSRLQEMTNPALARAEHEPLSAAMRTWETPSTRPVGQAVAPRDRPVADPASVDDFASEASYDTPTTRSGGPRSHATRIRSEAHFWGLTEPKAKRDP